MDKPKKIYKVVFDDKESYTKRISFVLDPAIQSNFLHFNNIHNFSINNERREVIGYAMLPDVVIGRGEMGDVFFSKDDIRQHAMKFFREGWQDKLNIDHEDNDAGSYIFQTYIVDETLGVSAPKHLESIDGGWIVGAKIENDGLWNDIKSGKVKGFSIELSGMKLVDETNDVNIEQTPNDELDKVYSKIKYYLEKVGK